MKLDKKKLTRWIGALSFAVLAPLAHAGVNFVDNGDFSIGPPVGWDVASEFGGCSIALGGGSASFLCALSFGSASLEQELQLTSAHTLSFSLATFFEGPSTREFKVSWGAEGLSFPQFGVDTTPDVYSLDLPAGHSFLVFELKFDTTEATSFAGVGLDNVSVSALQQNVPEPGTLVLVGAALAVVGVLRRKKPV